MGDPFAPIPRRRHRDLDTDGTDERMKEEQQLYSNEAVRLSLVDDWERGDKVGAFRRIDRLELGTTSTRATTGEEEDLTAVCESIIGESIESYKVFAGPR